jgi:hypothetical protein
MNTTYIYIYISTPVSTCFGLKKKPMSVCARKHNDVIQNVHIKCSILKPQCVIPEIHETLLAPCYLKNIHSFQTDKTALYLDECPIFKCQAVFLN